MTNRRDFLASLAAFAAATTLGVSASNIQTDPETGEIYELQSKESCGCSYWIIHHPDDYYRNFYQGKTLSAGHGIKLAWCSTQHRPPSIFSINHGLGGLIDTK